MIGKSGGEAKERNKPQKSCRRDMGNEGDLSRRRKNVDKRMCVVGRKCRPRIYFLRI